MGADFSGGRKPRVLDADQLLCSFGGDLMCRPHARPSTLALCLLAATLLAPRVSWSGAVEVTACGQQVFGGRAFLTGDLDCTGVDGTAAVVLSPGRLDLNGFTITGGNGIGVLLLGRSRIEGPGRITGSFEENVAQWNDSTVTKIRNVTISNSITGSGVRAPFEDSKVIVRDATITGNARHGIETSRLVRVRGGTIANNGLDGVIVEPTSCRTRPRLVIRGAVVTGNGLAPECGTLLQCADVAAGCPKPPRLRETTCDHSYVLGSGIPGMDWGLCALD
jgi:Right handed beta helix region